MLGLSASGLRPAMQQQQPGRPVPPMGPAARFVLPVQQAEFQLIKALEQLQKDPWPVSSERRNLRCTGVALSVAIGLMESSFQNAGGRVMLFAGGPATEGPGMVVGPELREPIRSHHDIDRDNIKYYKKALKVGEGSVDLWLMLMFPSSTTTLPREPRTTAMLSTSLLDA